MEIVNGNGRGRPKGSRTVAVVARELAKARQQLINLEVREASLRSQLTLVEEKIVSTSAKVASLSETLEDMSTTLDSVSAAPYDVKEGEAA